MYGCVGMDTVHSDIKFHFKQSGSICKSRLVACFHQQKSVTMPCSSFLTSKSHKKLLESEMPCTETRLNTVTKELSAGFLR